jgi:hypothetical protein
MPFFNPFTPFGGRTFLDGAAIAFRGATATRATGGFMARLDAGSIFVPPVGYGYGDASVGLSFDAGFAPAGSVGLTVSVSGVCFERGSAVAVLGYAEARAAARITMWEFSPDRKRLLRSASAATPAINVLTSPIGWQMASQNSAPLTASIFRTVIPGLFYRCGISAELSTISYSAFTGYALSGSNFTFDFPVAFFSFV